MLNCFGIPIVVMDAPTGEVPLLSRSHVTCVSEPSQNKNRGSTERQGDPAGCGFHGQCSGDDVGSSAENFDPRGARLRQVDARRALFGRAESVLSSHQTSIGSHGVQFELERELSPALQNATRRLWLWQQASRHSFCFTIDFRAGVLIWLHGFKRRLGSRGRLSRVADEIIEGGTSQRASTSDLKSDRVDAACGIAPRYSF